MHLRFVPEGEFEPIVHSNPPLLKASRRRKLCWQFWESAPPFWSDDCSRSMTK